MTDKQIIKPRPICLYEDTCLHLKEKTRLCEDCIHHKNYWSELLEKEQVEKIKSLEQECEKLKKQVCGLRPELKYIINKTCSKYNIEAKYYHEKIIEIINNLNKLSKTLTEIKEIAKENIRIADLEGLNGVYRRGLATQILQKISECEVKCENSNCYYKQLKRKEQECEELKKELMKKDEVDTFFNTPIEGWSNDPCEICKYKQTLIEIKEIAKMDICSNCITQKRECNCQCLTDTILQKITKALQEIRQIIKEQTNEK